MKYRKDMYSLETRYHQIRQQLKSFARLHLDREPSLFLFNLLERFHQKAATFFRRGKPEVWAGALVYLIARLNYWFSRFIVKV